MDILKKYMDSVTPKVFTLKAAMESIDAVPPALDEVTAADLTEDAIAHLQAEANLEDLDSLREYCERNQEEHNELRREVSDVREAIGAVVAAMEMLSTISNEEYIEEASASVVSDSLARIATKVDLPAPVVDVENGLMTTDSMESVGSFLKKLLSSAMSKIKASMARLRMWFVQTQRSDAALYKRVLWCMKQLDSLPQDYGIPSGKVVYKPGYAGRLRDSGHPVPFDAEPIRDAISNAIKDLAFVNGPLVTDVTWRIEAIADILPECLVARDQFASEQKLQALIESVSKPMAYFEYARARKESTGGVVHPNPDTAKTTPYRTWPWLASYLNMLEVYSQTPRAVMTAAYDVKTVSPQELRDNLAIITDHLLGAPEFKDTSWYMAINEAYSVAWNAFNKVIDILVHAGSTLPQGGIYDMMDSIFESVEYLYDGTYSKAVTMCDGVRGFANAVVYIAEQQIVEYKKVNR